MLSLETLYILLTGVCSWCLSSVYLYHFPPVHLKLPPSHSSRLLIGGAGCSFFHCCTTLLASSIYLMVPTLELGRHIALFSSSYFLYDTLHQLYNQPQRIYLIHHVTCISVWLIILNYNQGYTLACEFLWVAELSNLVRIPWELSSKLKWHDWNLDNYNRQIYLLSRCILLPLHLVLRTPSLLSLSFPMGIPYLLWLTCCIFIGVGIYWRPTNLVITV